MVRQERRIIQYRYFKQVGVSRRKKNALKGKSKILRHQLNTLRQACDHALSEQKDEEFYDAIVK